MHELLYIVNAQSLLHVSIAGVATVIGCGIGFLVTRPGERTPYGSEDVVVGVVQEPMIAVHTDRTTIPVSTILSSKPGAEESSSDTHNSRVKTARAPQKRSKKIIVR